MLRLIVMPTASSYVVSLKSAAPNALTCSIFKIPTLHITPTATQISAAMVEDYKLATFKVSIEDDFILRLDEINQQLVRLFAVDQVKSAAFITACNSFSQPTSDQENPAAPAEFEAEIRSFNLNFYPGQGEDLMGHWAAERSALIMGVSLEQATLLGVRYQQNAIVWIGHYAKPQLLLLR